MASPSRSRGSDRVDFALRFPQRRAVIPVRRSYPDMHDLFVQNGPARQRPTGRRHGKHPLEGRDRSLDFRPTTHVHRPACHRIRTTRQRRRCTVAARGGQSDRTPVGCHQAMPTTPSARRWWPTGVRCAPRERRLFALGECGGARLQFASRVAALAIAITACSANDCSRATWVSEKPPGSIALSAIEPMTVSPRSSGSCQYRLGSIVAYGLEQPRFGISVADVDDPFFEQSARHAMEAVRSLACMGNCARNAACAAGSMMADVERTWISSPSYSVSRSTTTPLHSSRARRVIRSNTGWVSPGEADIAFRTSMVADCCSMRSPYSLLRSASAAVRACSFAETSSWRCRSRSPPVRRKSAAIRSGSR